MKNSPCKKMLFKNFKEYSIVNQPLFNNLNNDKKLENQNFMEFTRFYSNTVNGINKKNLNYKQVAENHSLNTKSFDALGNELTKIIDKKYIRRILSPIVPRKGGRNLFGIVFLEKVYKHSESKCKFVELEDIINLNSKYCFRNKKFPYKSSSNERPKKLENLVKFKEEPIKEEQSRNIKLVGKCLKGKKKSSSVNELGMRKKNLDIDFAEEIIKSNILGKSRNNIICLKKPA